MTREEAIRLIGWLKCTTNREDDLEAIDMAIEALQAVAEQEAVPTVVRVTMSDGSQYYLENERDAIQADAVSREFYEDAVKANIGLELKQTDTLIIADALRYLAQDTERHLTDRTRADALRQQFLKYGASMCKGGANE